MSKPYSLKRMTALACAFVITAGCFGNGLNYTKATADDEQDIYSAADEYFYEGSDQTLSDEQLSQADDIPVYTPEEYIQDDTSSSLQENDGQEDTQQNEQSSQQDSSSQSDSSSSSSSSSSNSSSTGFDITAYAKRLREISQQQELLEEDLSQADSEIESEKENQQKLQKKIDIVNEKIDVINEYMTALEIQISTNKRELKETEDEIADGVEGFKKRLRAMYIAGTDSYTTVILESNSFYDVLMRLELIKRVASHDNSMIDNLYSLKDKYEAKQAELEQRQAEYDKQAQELDSQKQELDELYASSEETMKQLEEKQKALKEQNEAYEKEKTQFESDLSGILKSSNGNSSRDSQVAATMAIADVKLDELHESIRQRLKDGEQLGEYEPQYKFAWPVPGCYSVSSGVGPRWGSYHSGIDIPGAHGTAIHASESGTVIRINTTCTHDYGKTKSCGCGGGYGNYIIIDHGNEFITLYGHLTEVDVQVGDKVKQGDVIGKMGTTGFSTGDHLHFEIRYQGYIVNPAYYVNIT